MLWWKEYVQQAIRPATKIAVALIWVRNPLESVKYLSHASRLIIDCLARPGKNTPSARRRRTKDVSLHQQPPKMLYFPMVAGFTIRILSMVRPVATTPKVEVRNMSHSSLPHHRSSYPEINRDLELVPKYGAAGCKGLWNNCIKFTRLVEVAPSTLQS